MKIKVLTGVLSAGLIAVISGNIFASKDVTENKYFTHTEVRDGHTYANLQERKQRFFYIKNKAN